MPSELLAYKYYAFISYSRKDSKVAAWLQKRLEWFRFPVKLVPEDRRPSHPRYPEMNRRLEAQQRWLPGLTTPSAISTAVARTEEVLLDELIEWQLAAKNAGTH